MVTGRLVPAIGRDWCKQVGVSRKICDVVLPSDGLAALMARWFYWRPREGCCWIVPSSEPV